MKKDYRDREWEFTVTSFMLLGVVLSGGCAISTIFLLFKGSADPTWQPLFTLIGLVIAAIFISIALFLGVSVYRNSHKR